MLLWTWGCRYLFDIVFLFPADTFPEVELLDHMVVLFLIFCGNSHTVFHSGCTKLHSHWQCARVSFSPHPHQHLLSLVFLIIAILTGVEVISYCGFDLHFPDDKWYWATFHVPVGHLCIFFGKLPIQFLCPCLTGLSLLLLYIFAIEVYEFFIYFRCQPFIRYMICKYFFHSVCCLFILSTISFTVHKFFSSM